jgi:NADPH2:quinone reductase
VIAAPDGIGDHTLAAAVHSVPIALHLVRVAAIDVPAGSGSDATVLVLGALGAVGSVLVQLAVAAGARVIAAVRTDAQHEAALALGAQAAISTVSTASTGGSDCVDQLRAVAPDGIDVAYDSTGDADVLAVALAALAWRGTLITCAGRADARLAVDPGELYRRRQRIIGAAAADLRDVHDGLELVASGQVRVAEAGRFGLQDFRVAYALLAERSRTGKVVFEVTQ